MNGLTLFKMYTTLYFKDTFVLLYISIVHSFPVHTNMPKFTYSSVDGFCYAFAISINSAISILIHVS